MELLLVLFEVWLSWSRRLQVLGIFQLFNPFMQELTYIANFLKTVKINKIPYKISMKFTVFFESVSSADLIS